MIVFVRTFVWDLFVVNMALRFRKLFVAKSGVLLRAVPWDP